MPLPDKLDPLAAMERAALDPSEIASAIEFFNNLGDGRVERKYGLSIAGALNSAIAERDLAITTAQPTQDERMKAFKDLEAAARQVCHPCVRPLNLPPCGKCADCLLANALDELWEIQHGTSDLGE